MNFRSEVAAKLHIGAHEVRILSFINWCAPSTHSANASKSQVELLAWALAENTNNLGIVLMPVHSNHKNKVVLTEKTAMDRLGKCSFNLDHQFCVLFSHRVDGRDNRPLMYPGRLIFPGALLDVRSSPWFQSALRVNGRTAFAPQLAAKDMAIVEDLDPNALPKPLVDHPLGERFVSGAHKYEQLGVAGSEALWESVTDGADLTDAPALLFLITSAQVDDDILAIINLSLRHRRPFYILAVSEDEAANTWVHCRVHDHIKALLKDQKLFLAGMGPISDKPATDAIGHYCALPQFHVMVPKGRVATGPGLQESGEVLPKDVTLEMPLHIYKKWHGNQFDHHRTFQEWMEKHRIAVVAEPGPADPAPKPVKNSAAAEPPLKKANMRVDPATLVDNTTITEALLWEVKIQTPRHEVLKLQLRVGMAYIVNVGTGEANFNYHSFLTGFGKGSFKLMADGDAASPLEFQLKSSDDLVVINGNVMKLEEVLALERKKKPTATIYYHDLVDSETEPGKFTLKQTHRVLFVPTTKPEGGAAPTLQNAGAELSPSQWNTHATMLIWQVRWVAKGLQAVGPRVYTTHDLALAPGLGCKLCNSQP